MKKAIGMLLALIMVFALMPASAVLSRAESFEPPMNENAVGVKDEDETDLDPDRIVTFLVKLRGAPVASRARSLDSEAARKVRSLLIREQEAVMDKAAALFNGGKAEFPFAYQLLFNGFAVKAPYSMRQELEALPEVESVFAAPEYYAPEDTGEPGTRLSTSVGLIGAEEAWELGYTGSGTAIAIIDTGCVLGHEAFSVTPADGKLNTSSLASALQGAELHAEELYSGTLSASSVYYSGKIPFRFNYSNGSLNVAHSYSGSDHGSHSAGVAAGNGPSEYKGVAKDAQLVIMQVYDQEGVADWATVMAALEDCAYLGVDAVNVSFGQDLGFSEGSAEIEAVFSLLASRGVNVAASAGDSGSSTGQQYYGSAFSYALAMNPDNGIVSAPATYSGPLAVAGCTKQSPSMSNYSNAGSTADLKLKPEITAPGVDIYAPVDPDNSGAVDQYGAKSGASTAAAHVSGAQAILTRYVSDTFPSLSAAQQAEMVDRLLMCTAQPISGVSPRRQGAGVMNIASAVSTGAYLTVNGSSRPKLELGDDKNRTGVYTLSFDIVNFSAAPLTFTPQVQVLTPTIGSRKLNGEYVNYIKGTCDDITSSCTVNAPASVTVPANGTSSVTVTVTLSAAKKAALDSSCPNGMYIEGFVKLDGSTPLSLPFLAFYGNWNSASVFDRYTYIDQIMGLQKLNVHNKQLQVGSYIDETSFMLFGANPYADTSDFLADRCTLSPNGDGYFDSLDRVAAAILRNCSAAGLSITKAGDPSTVYFSEELSSVPKSWRYKTGNYSYSWNYATDWFGFRGWDPSGLNEGDRVIFSMWFDLDNPGFTASQNECSRIDLPITVDTQAPEIVSWSISGGTMELSVRDEHYTAWVGVYADPGCTNLLSQQVVTETSPGAVTALTMSTGIYSTVYVVMGDYGRNTSEVFKLTGSGPNPMSSVTAAPDALEIIPGQTVSVELTVAPANANVRSVVWESSDAAKATVDGSGLTAAVTGVKRGECSVSALVTDMSGNTITVTVPVTVRRGYAFDHFEPTTEIESGTEYLIGFDTGDGVYLLMNSNPNPLQSDELCFTSGGTDYCYGIKAVLDGEGNVTGVDTSVYPDAELINAEWDLVPVSGYYQVRSRYDASYYLKVTSAALDDGLFPSYGTGGSTKWSWDADAHHLSFANISGYKTVTYKASIGGYSDFFGAPPIQSDESCVTLYKHVSGVVFLDDPSLLGDVDCNGSVTMGDASLLAAYFLNMTSLSEQALLNADANDDNSLDVLDISAVCSIALGR